MATHHSSFSAHSAGETPAVRGYNRGLHFFALITAVATFPLIFIGGLVTSHGAGLSVPDWPNSYGYNMFLFPPSQWVGNIWYEHVHRLYASGIGLLCIVLCAWTWLSKARKSVRWLATGLLGLVIFQGILGGLRVILIQIDLAIVHGCTAQAFFCLTALMAMITSRWWANAPSLADLPDAGRGGRLIKFAFPAFAIVFGQLILGAVMRHYQAGLAIPDFPTAWGHALPPLTTGEFRERVLRSTQLPAEAPAYLKFGWTPPTFKQVWLHFAHRVGALIVSIALLTLITRAIRLRHRNTGVLAFSWCLLLLLLAQLTLGILTVLLRKPADIASAHVAVGALVLMTTFLLSMMLLRLYRPRLDLDDRAFQPVFGRVRAGAAPATSFDAIPATRATS